MKVHVIVVGGVLGLAVAGCNRSKVETPHPLIEAAGAGKPMGFEPNQGQAPESIRFLSRGAGYAVYLQPDTATLAFHGAAKNARLRMTLRGARANAPAHAETPLAGTTNYYVGKRSQALARGRAHVRAGSFCRGLSRHRRRLPRPRGTA